MPTVDTPAKARSRLNPEQKETLQQRGRSQTSESTLKSLAELLSQLSFSRFRTVKNSHPTLHTLSLRRTTATVAVLAGIFSLWYLLTQVSPQTVANLVFYQSYVPLLLLVFATGAAFVQIFSSSLHRSVLLPLPLVILLFLHLQSVSLTPFLVLISLGVLWGSEVLLSLVFRS